MADRIVAAEKADRTPNWDKWFCKYQLALWQLVALSLSIDPDKVNMIEDSRTGTVIFNESPLFLLRLREVRERLGKNGMLVEYPKYHWMTLPAFAACARGWSWDMPPEMLAMADIPASVHEFGVRARADKQKPTTAEGNANVEPRTHNKRESDARYREWQEAIDGLAREHPGQSHSKLCQKLDPRIGVPWQTIRRNTKLGHS